MKILNLKFFTTANNEFLTNAHYCRRERNKALKTIYIWLKFTNFPEMLMSMHKFKLEQLVVCSVHLAHCGRTKFKLLICILHTGNCSHNSSKGHSLI
jgi:hypothetical protein